MERLALVKAAVVALSFAVGAMPSLAGPVQTDALGAAAEVGALPAASASSPGLTHALPDGAPATLRAAPDVAARAATGERGAAEAAPSSATLAAEILREAGMTQQPSAAVPSALRQLQKEPTGPTSHVSPARPSGKSSMDDAALAEVRDFGKAAVQWVKGALPWRSDDAHDGPATVPTEINWADGPSREVGAAIKLIVESGQDKSATRSDAGAGNTASDAKAGTSAGNLVRDGIQAAQKFLSHPMTWLVLSLVVIGVIAMSLADRRPK